MSVRTRICGGGIVVLVAMFLVAGCADKPDALIASAKEYLAKNERNSAVIQLKNALQKNPDLAEARFLLGKALLELGEIPAAEKELRKAVELKYPTDEVAPLLARALVTRGAHKNAIEEFSGAEVKTPEGKADLQTTLGEARMAMGDVEAARAAFAAANAAVPDYPPALLGQARLKASTRDFAGALLLLDTALAKSPKLTDGWQLKGDLLNAQKRPDDALVAYRQALAVQPNYVPAHSSIVTLMIGQGKIEDARKQLEAMKAVAAKNPATLYLQAQLAFQEKNFVAAREAIRQQLELAPNNILGLLLGAQIDFQLGSYAQAQSTLQTVLQLAPGLRYARQLLVQSYLREGKRSKALDAIKPLLEQTEIDSNTLALAGEVYVQNGDVTTAARYFDQAAKLDPKSSGKRTSAAISHFAKGEINTSELESVAAEDKGIRADLVLYTASMRNRRFDEASAAVAAIEKKQPDSPLSHNLRGALLVAKGDIAGARKSFERGLAIDPSDLPTITNLARLDLLEKKPEEAKKRFEAVLARDPKNSDAYLALAALRAQAGGSTDEVAALVSKAIAANPSDPKPRLVLVSLYMRGKDPNKAVAAAQDALAAMPDRAEILEAAGQAYRDAGDTNQAIAVYNKLAALRPDSPSPHLRIAYIQVAAKNEAAAIESLRKALAISPNNVEARRAMAALDFSAGRVKEALASARELQRQYPTQSVGYLLEGEIHARQKAWNDAISVYRKGLAKAGTADLAISLDIALRAAGKSSDADKFIAGWLRDHPKDRLIHTYLAQTAIKNQDYAGAARHYNTVLEIQPNDALALNNLAYVSGRINDPKAIEYAEQANKLAPNNPMILDTLGTLLVAKGDTKRGLELLQSAARLAPTAGVIHLNLARALIKDGQKEGAKKELEALAKLGDKFSEQAEVARLMQGL